MLVGGCTLHSWAGIGQAKDPDGALVARVLQDAAACVRWQTTELLVIDEISMVSGRLLDALSAIACAVRRCEAPFGGLQVLLCGDFHQLPPPGGPGWGILGSEPWAFEAACWGQAVDTVAELTEILRVQAGEQELAGLLAQVRTGRLDDHSWMMLQAAARRPREQAAARGAIEVVATNRAADGINRAAVERLLGDAASGTEVVFHAQAVGPGSDGRTPSSASTAAPLRLHLCRGATVILTQGVQPLGSDDRLVNGTRCRVVGFAQLPTHMYDHTHPGFTHDGAIDRALRPFLGKHAGWLPELVPIDGPEMAFLLHPAVLEDVDSCMVQLPMRLGWAITAHRAQGLTLHSAVVHLAGLFSPGQAYVALSRCRGLAGLRVEGAAQLRREGDGRVAAFDPDPKVKAFYAGLQA